MNTYTHRASNPFRMRTYKIGICKPRGMNTYKKVGRGCPIIVTFASPLISLGLGGTGTLPVRFAVDAKEAEPGGDAFHFGTNSI